jgi:3-hydroxyacyl-[acyl-carrier-protein] dehydratase
MDIQAIQAMLRHRYPFLLVDRVTACQPGQIIAGYKNLSAGECGAFSGDPGRYLPQLLVLEALAQIAVILTFRTLNVVPTGNELMFFAGIDKAVFHSSARCGDRLDLEARVGRLMPGKGIGKFLTRAEVGGRMVAEAEMMAAMRF